MRFGFNVLYGGVAFFDLAYFREIPFHMLVDPVCFAGEVARRNSI